MNTQTSSLADKISAGAKPGDAFIIVGFDASRHVHTFSGEPVQRPSDWFDGEKVVFLGWSEGAYVQRARFEINGSTYAGKGLASCILVEEIER